MSLDDAARAIKAWDAKVERYLHLSQYGATREIRRAAELELCKLEPPGGAPFGTVPDPKFGLQLLADGVKEAEQELDRFDAHDFSHRLSTGLQTLDMRIRGGFAAGQVTLIGAPTGGGKTTLLVQMCMSAAKQGPVLIVSPEMSNAQLAEREIVRRSRCPVWDRNPWSADTINRESARYGHSQAAVEISGERLPLYVMDRTDTTMADVEEAASQIHGLRMLAIDYAQQVAGDDERQARYLQVGQVGSRSVILAERLGIPVVLASQVNVVEEKGKRREYKFRESEILSHKAHNVIVLDVEWDSDNDDSRKVNRATVVCSKQRNGSPFRLRVHFDPQVYEIADRRRGSTVGCECCKDETSSFGPSRLAALPRA